MKILVISHNAFSELNNNGKTFESLFRFIDRENLAQLFFSQNEVPDFKYCSHYFRVTDTDVLKRFFRLSRTCGQELDESKFVQVKSSALFDIAKRKSRNLVVCRDFLWKIRLWKSKELKRWCLKIDPDLIFFVGGDSEFSHDVAINIARLVNRPLVCYFTDDYLIYPRNRNLIDFIQRSRMRRFYKKTIERSSLAFVIGHLMAQEYEKYFKRPFIPIMNSVGFEPYLPYPARDTIILSYFGGLHLERWKMLVKLACSLRGSEIHVYSIQEPNNDVIAAFKQCGIVYKGGVQGESLKKAIINSDILLHVESDDAFYRRLTMLSISTKIPEYLMSGRPVLGFGPSEVASMRLLVDNQIGIVLSCEMSKEALDVKLAEIVGNYNLRKEIGYKGYKYAIENFNNDKITQNLKLRLETIIK